MTESIHGLPIEELDLLVKKIAHSVPTISHSVDFEDLCTIGMVAALEAAKRYDDTKGAKFSTYVWQSIRGDMLTANRDYARAGKAVGTREERKAWTANTAKVEHDFRLDADVSGTDAPGRTAYDKIMIDNTDPTDALRAKEICEGFQAYLASLSGKHRYILACLAGGLSYREIGESMWNTTAECWGLSKQRIEQIVRSEIFKGARKSKALKELMA